MKDKSHMFLFRKKVFILLGVSLLIVTGIISVYAKSRQDQNRSGGCQAVMLANEEFFPVLVKSIDEARDEIIMSVFSFKAGKHRHSYPDQIAGCLERAVKRGVKVFVVLETTDDKADELNIQNRKAGKFLEGKGIKVFFDSPRKTTHTKLTVIDQKLILLGSHNFTQSALRYNNEISILLNSPDLAGNARNYILKIIKEGE
jgi:phosphatidylserine/phosphatidylglycerophosphate/cardiolipin synthase-like enzyme